MRKVVLNASFPHFIFIGQFMKFYANVLNIGEIIDIIIEYT